MQTDAKHLETRETYWVTCATCGMLSRSDNMFFTCFRCDPMGLKMAIYTKVHVRSHLKNEIFLGNVDGMKNPELSLVLYCVNPCSSPEGCNAWQMFPRGERN